MQHKLAGWQGKLLSPGAKLVLIKSVLLALPIYFLALIDPHAFTITEMQKLASSFFWNDSIGNHRCHLVSWNKICMPLDEGG